MSAVPNDSPTLPPESSLGTEGSWRLLDRPYLEDDVRSRVITGQFVGHTSSRQAAHNHAQARPLPGERCGACRWTELRLFWVDLKTHAYVLHSAGPSVIPGEVTLASLKDLTSVYQVFEELLDRRGARPRLPKIAAQLLASAAEHDDDVRDLYLGNLRAGLGGQAAS